MGTTLPIDILLDEDNMAMMKRAKAPVVQQTQQVQQAPPGVEVVLCVPDDQRRYLPRRTPMPERIGLAEKPLLGEIIMFDEHNAWSVSLVIHTWPWPTQHRIEVWLERLSSRMGHERPSGFSVTR